MPLEQAPTLRVVARFLDGRMLKGTTRQSGARLTRAINPR